jgi:hypothetical protein
MRAAVRLALCTTALLGLAGPAVAFAAAPAPAAVEVPVCEQTLPAATDGVVTLDTPTVRAGGTALGVLTGVAQWPAGLVGGGSGETFLSCTPWTPLGDAEVMTTPEAGLFLVDVPAGTPAGTYPVSLVYYEGSQQTSGADGTLVRLGTTLTVTTAPVAVPSVGAACSIPGAPAASGQLVTVDTVAAGGVVRLGLTAVTDPRIYFNEYDALWFVACLDGVATPVLQDVASTPFDLTVPAGTPAGPHTIRLWGAGGLQVMWWERTVVVTPAPAPDPNGLAITGASTAAGATAATFLALGGVALVLVRRRSAAARGQASTGVRTGHPTGAA